MGRLNLNSKCPCGADIKGEIKKPTRFVDSFAKVNCDKCQSRFMFTCTIDKKEPGRVFTTHIDILWMSPRAESILSKQFPIKAKLALEKVANAAGFKQNAEHTKIQTDLDQTE